MKKLAAAAIVLVAAANPAPPPNLLELTRGASVVSRTAEASLETAAVRVIDGADNTSWAPPLDDVRQSIVLSLPARARLEQLGIVPPAKAYARPKHVQFETSLDGVAFTDRGTFAISAATTGPQLFAVGPAEAKFVRVTTLDGASGAIGIATAYAAGALLDPVAPPSLDGCWSINGFAASFKQNRAQVVGTVEKTSVDGGSDGRFFRFAWTRGAEYGLAAVSVSIDGKHLAGMPWHEEAIMSPPFYAPAWLGDRAPCGPAAPRDDVFRAYVTRFGYFPMFGLRFDDAGRLDEAESAAALDRLAAFVAGRTDVRLAAHELRLPTPQQNRAASETKLATLRDALAKRGVDVARIAFVPLGAEQPHREAHDAITRAMYSSVDLELRR